jgi:hypothetical protein
MTRSLERTRDYVPGNSTWTVSLIVTAPGPVGTLWTVRVGGHVATYTTVLNDTTALVAEGLKLALDALDGVAATRSSSTVLITTDQAATCGFDSDWGTAEWVATEGRTLTITAGGATGVIWTAAVIGLVANYTVLVTDTTPTLVATGLAAAIDALAGVTATRSGAVITVTYAVPADPADSLVVTNNGAGTDTNVAVAAPASTRSIAPASGSPGANSVYRSV